VENIGIGRTYDKIEQATLILYVCDISQIDESTVNEMLEEFKTHIEDESKHFILVGNKIDQLDEVPPHLKDLLDLETVFVSAKRKENIHLLAETLVDKVKDNDLQSDVIVTNTRHFEALSAALSSVEQVEAGLQNDLPGDLVAIDLRQALHYLGTVTGKITTNEILGSIFSKFCIGK
jgi:tRNA modification GTPase